MNRKGFTLIEMMIVIAIIAVLAAVALPNMLGARKAAAEKSAMSELKTLGTAAEAYYIREGSYPTNTSSFLSDLASKDLLSDYYSDKTGSYTKSGYTINVTQTTSDEYNIVATPVSAKKGNKCYKVTTGGVLYQADFNGSCGTFEEI